MLNISVQGLEQFSGTGLDDLIREEIAEPVERIQKGVSLDLWDFLTTEATYSNSFGSPVWTGAYIASHRISVNSIDVSFEKRPSYAAVRYTTGLTSLKPLGMGYAKSQVSNAKIGDTIYISNSAPYAQALERGLSRKTPDGIYNVAMDVAEVRLTANISKYLTGVM